MSRRKSRRGGPGRWMIAGGVVLALLMAANLVVGLQGMSDEKGGGEPTGFLTPDILAGVAFWVPFGISLAACVCGMWWSTQAFADSERGSLLWLRRSLSLGLAGTCGLAVAAFETVVVESKVVPLFDRRTLSIAFAWLLVLILVNVALATLREKHAAEGSNRPRRRRRSSSSSDDHHDDDDGAGDE